MKRVLLSLVATFAFGAFVVAQDVKKNTKPVVKNNAATAKEKLAMRNLVDSFSYAAGLNIAANMKDQGITNVNSQLMAKAISDFFEGKAKAMSTETANTCLQAQMKIYSDKKNEEANKKMAAEAAKSKAYLEANKLRTGVITLPDGLQYEVIKAGEPDGVKPTVQDTVVVNYVGKLIDGTEFDSSVKNGGPITFSLQRVIKGWTEILQLMTKGAHWKVHIPSDLAYGERGMGPLIQPGAALVFDIMLEDIKPAAVK